MTKLDDLALHMITYYAADPARIQHFIKAVSYTHLSRSAKSHWRRTSYTPTATALDKFRPVSYTHLDVYKRQ